MKNTPVHFFFIEHKYDSIGRVLGTIKSKLLSIFEPEEVEVTFKRDSKIESYSYRKIPRKRMA